MIEISHVQARRMVRQGLDRRLPEEQWVVLQAHLDVCAECRAYREQHRKSERGVRQTLQRRWWGVAGPRQNLPKQVTAYRQARKLRIGWMKRAASGLGLLLMFGLCSLLTFRLSMAPPPPTIEPTPRPSRTPPARQATLSSSSYSRPTQLPGLVAVYSSYEPASQAGATSVSGAALAANSNICLLTLSLDEEGETYCFDHPAEDSSPAWSPDGNWLAFLSDRGADGMRPSLRRDIYVMTVAGTRLARLTSEPAFDWQGPISWSANGRWLAAVGTDLNNNERWIYLISAHGEGRPRPIGHTRNGRLPRFAPTGSRLAYEMNDSSFHGLAVVDVESGTFIKVSEPDLSNEPASIADLGFDWSPDGTRLAYLVQKSLPDGGSTREMRVSAPLDERFFTRPVSNEPGDSLTAPLEILTEARKPGQPERLIAWPVWLPGGEGLLYLEALGELEISLPDGMQASRPCMQPRLALLPERPALPTQGKLAPLCITQYFDRTSWVLPAAGQTREVPWLVVAGAQPGEQAQGLYGIMWPLADKAAGLVRLTDIPSGLTEGFLLRPRR